MRQRRKFKKKFKSDIVNLLETKQRTMKDICLEHDLNPSMVARWKSMARARQAVRHEEPKRIEAEQKDSALVKELKTEIADLYLLLKKRSSAQSRGLSL